MYTIALHREDSPIEYEKIQYPDGQISLKINETHLEILKSTGSVTIESRMDNYTDLMYILAANDILRDNDVERVRLEIKCMLGQRSDRRFSSNQSFDLKILAQILASQKFHSIGIFHPHSDVICAQLEALGTKAYAIESKVVVAVAIRHIKNTNNNTSPILISPDAGAFKWVKKLSEELGMDCIASNKIREENKLTIDVHGDVKDRICLIVDDYCDGGATFNLLAAELKKQGAAKVYLSVAHALFSAGFDKLKENLELIFTTNSISHRTHELDTEFVREIPI